jgi:hypothetical protein
VALAHDALGAAQSSAAGREMVENRVYFHYIDIYIRVLLYDSLNLRFGGVGDFPL